MNAAIDLLTRSLDAPTRPASSSWVIGNWKSSSPPASSSEPLGGAAGHVEKDRVRQGRVGVAQPFGQQAHHLPQQLGLGVQGARAPRRTGCRASRSAPGPAPRPNECPGRTAASRRTGRPPPSGPPTTPGHRSTACPTATRPLRTTNNSSASSSSSKTTTLRSQTDRAGRPHQLVSAARSNAENSSLPASSSMSSMCDDGTIRPARRPDPMPAGWPALTVADWPSGPSTSRPSARYRLLPHLAPAVPVSGEGGWYPEENPGVSPREPHVI